MSDQPPPYMPHPHSGPSAPGFPSAGFNTQPSAYPGSPYPSLVQAFPQTSGGDHSYYHGPPGHMGPLGSPDPYLTHPGSHGYQSGPQPWDGPTAYGEPSKHSMYLVDQNHGGDGGGGGEKSCLAACSAALCCCCLWDLLTNSLF